jgi:hypothetical protein
LGDVFGREISKFGRFAFRGKHSKGESSKRFVEEFVKLHERCRTELDEEERKKEEQEKEGKNEGEIGKHTKSCWARPGSPIGPKFPYGTCMSHLVSHSWSDSIREWLWVPKGEALAAAERD